MNPAPLNSPITEKGDKLPVTWQVWLQALSDRMLPATSGVTSGRPTAKLYVGLTYFDSTLGKPVFLKSFNPTPVWVDATGAVV